MKSYWYKGDWDEKKYNIGDGVTPIILNYLTEKKYESCQHNESNKLMTCGSVIEFIENGDIIWGSGLISPMKLDKKINVDIRMIRGPLTRDCLMSYGYDVPAFYGDPCMILPEIIKGHQNRSHKIGIIPHYTEYDEYKEKFPSYFFIDIMNNISTFVDDINKCEKIISSSLHGIIISEAYGIRSEYLRLTDRIIGGDFKFKDYYLGTGREIGSNEKPNTNINKIKNTFPHDRM